LQKYWIYFEPGPTAEGSMGNWL